MGLIEEEHHFRLFQIACFRQEFKQLGEHPQQEGSVHGRIVNQSLAIQYLDAALSVTVSGEPVGNIQGGFAEELFSAFSFKCYHGTDNGG